MALSNKTIQKLSNALTDEVIEYIYNDERWYTFLMEMVPDAISNKLGDVDEELQYELAMTIMDKIVLKSYKVDS